MSRAKDEIENQEAEVQIPQEVAVLPSGETVIYPEMVIPLAAGEEKMVKLIDDVLSGDKILGLFAQRSGGEGTSADNIYNVSTDSRSSLAMQTLHSNASHPALPAVSQPP